MNNHGFSEFLNENFKNKLIDSILMDIEGAEFLIMKRFIG